MLEEKVQKHVDLLIKRYPSLENIKEYIVDTYRIIERCYENDGKLLIAGNGGSAADSEHIAGELMKGFKIQRQIPNHFANKLRDVDSIIGDWLARILERGLMAIPLVGRDALNTAYINDVDGLGIFAQQLYCLGRKGDVFLAISTSGNSKNIIAAAIAAKAIGMNVIGLTGMDGGKLSELANVSIRVPEKETYMVQELHLPIYHCICLMLEEHFFGEEEG